jgi:hypothetical protein
VDLPFPPPVFTSTIDVARCECSGSWCASGGWLVLTTRPFLESWLVAASKATWLVTAHFIACE